MEVKPVSVALREKLFRNLSALLSAERLPFAHVVLLYQDHLIEVLYAPDGLQSGTLQLRIDENAKCTASLTWTMDWSEPD